jgi:hypothetical protein
MLLLELDRRTQAEGVARYCKEHREPEHERRQLLRMRMRVGHLPVPS